MTEGLQNELKEFGVDVLGIRSFGLSPTPAVEEEDQQNWYQAFFQVTAK